MQAYYTSCTEIKKERDKEVAVIAKGKGLEPRSVVGLFQFIFSTALCKIIDA
jgi:hypothetical protein